NPVQPVTVLSALAPASAGCRAATLCGDPERTPSAKRCQRLVGVADSISNRSAPPAFGANMYKLLSFDVYGTLVNTPPINANVFRSILDAANAPHVEAQAFYQFWEQRNISHYFKPYRSYKEICRFSLQEAFEHFGIHGGDPDLIGHYFSAFKHME